MIPTDKKLKENVANIMEIYQGHRQVHIDVLDGELFDMAKKVRDQMRPELSEVMAKQAEVKPELLKLPIEKQQEHAIAAIELSEHIELGQCECGQEHDIRFMATDSEGNHICFECYRAWVGEFTVHVRELLRVRAELKKPVCHDLVVYEAKVNSLIDQIGENYTNIGEGWEEHVNEDWDEEYTSPEKREMAKLIHEAELEIAQARAEKFETLTKALLNVVASKDGRVLSAISTPDFQKKVKALHELIYG